jgi:hypothetical protein
MAAMNMVSARGFSGVRFHLKRCHQGVASALCKKNPHFWVPTIKVRPPDGICFIFSPQLRAGRLEFTYDDGRVVLPGSGVADGAWHNAEVTWMAGGKIWLSLDYGAREATGGPIRGDISGLLVESISLGGPPGGGLGGDDGQTPGTSSSHSKSREEESTRRGFAQN